MSREKQILDALTTSPRALTSMGIVKIIYKDVPEALWPMAENNVKLHLEKLRKENKIVIEARPGADDLHWKAVPSKI
ncbi:PREDICTED: endoribonuclease LACTB2-like [Amphimedon queenslandica]|nr:PREDICTED: endoribonuclease LACTB2-like [Amphimedon queenslandica]|eukprot:XP_019862688.1 PREDICTED: endoribonuclease LACTB2-like [Amphimedon queenslandica]